MKGFKLHTPTFHRGGRKYRLGAYGELKTSRRGRIGFSWRSGWRQHYSSDDGVSANAGYKLRSIRSLVRPQTSARNLVASGSYKNPLRSTVYG